MHTVVIWQVVTFFNLPRYNSWFKIHFSFCYVVVEGWYPWWYYVKVGCIFKVLVLRVTLSFRCYVELLLVVDQNRADVTCGIVKWAARCWAEHVELTWRVGTRPTNINGSRHGIQHVEQLHEELAPGQPISMAATQTLQHMKGSIDVLLWQHRTIEEQGYRRIPEKLSKKRWSDIGDTCPPKNRLRDHKVDSTPSYLFE